MSHDHDEQVDHADNVDGSLLTKAKRSLPRVPLFCGLIRSSRKIATCPHKLQFQVEMGAKGVYGGGKSNQARHLDSKFTKIHALQNVRPQHRCFKFPAGGLEVGP